MAGLFNKGATASNAINIHEDGNASANPISTTSSRLLNDDLEELDYVILPDDELLADEHTDEPASNPNSYSVPIEGYKEELQSYHINGLQLLAGGRMTVDFYNEAEIEFLKILYIRRDTHLQEVTLIGHRFIKNSHPGLAGALDTTYQDEVCWVVALVPNRDLGQLYEVPVESVISKRGIDLTNAPAPKGTYDAWLIRDDLVCRWKAIIHYPNSSRCKPSQSIIRGLQAAECDARWCVPSDELRRQARGKTLKGGSSRGIKPFEADRLQREAATRQRYADTAPTLPALAMTSPNSSRARTQPIRETIVLIGSDDDIVIELDDDVPVMTSSDARYQSAARPTTNPKPIDLERQLSPLPTTKFEPSTPRRRRSTRPTTKSEPMDLDGHRPLEKLTQSPRHVNRRRQRYSFGDSFCGAGGMSRGAQMAGLSIEWGFDRGEDQCCTWKQNFPYAKCHRSNVEEFLGANIDVKVDILHLSPPCQPYSPANTRPNRDKDEANTATGFAISELLNKCRPRIVTMENTAGLLQRKPEYFHRFIGLFTAKGYSVRWTVVDMANYGVPQRRQRLIIIAACHGESLPTFPPYTHAKNPTGHIAPWVSINTALSDIPVGWPDHNVIQAMGRGNGPRGAPDGNTVAKCVTCQGGENFKHPNGVRGYTNREFASLQTFPLYHEFRPVGASKITTVREQIGNAVPPRFAKVLYGWLRKWLEQEDGVQGPEIMEVDDDRV